MMTKMKTSLLVLAIASVAALLGYLVHDYVPPQDVVKPAEAAARTKVSPVKPLSDRDVYYPGTEALGPDEMRVIACGTGMPSVRPKQAAACWLVELGNGDKFLFDIGAQSMSRISAMKIPMDFLDKVFIGHLHLDHMADFPSLWIGGLKANRTYPLRVWGRAARSRNWGPNI